jgi:hypothetical protein
MRTVALVLAFLLVGAVMVAEDLPNNFAGAGLGYQNQASPQTSGWSEYCHRNPDIKMLGLTMPSYLCAATDYSGQVTSARVDLDTVLVYRSWFAAGTKTGGGAGVNSNGVGGAYALGVWGAISIAKVVKLDKLSIAASVTWNKDDVVVAQQAGQLPMVLKALGSRACYRFGFGKAW